MKKLFVLLLVLVVLLFVNHKPAFAQGGTGAAIADDLVSMDFTIGVDRENEYQMCLLEIRTSAQSKQIVYALGVTEADVKTRFRKACAALTRVSAIGSHSAVCLKMLDQGEFRCAQ